jgi:hypothetical protein
MKGDISELPTSKLGGFWAEMSIIIFLVIFVFFLFKFNNSCIDKGRKSFISSPFLNTEIARMCQRVFYSYLIMSAFKYGSKNESLFVCWSLTLPEESKRTTIMRILNRYAYPQLLCPQKSQITHLASHLIGWPHSSHIRWKGDLRVAILEARVSCMARAIASGHDRTSTPLLDFFATAADMHLMLCNWFIITLGSTPDQGSSGSSPPFYTRFDP